MEGGGNNLEGHLGILPTTGSMKNTLSSQIIFFNEASAFH